MLGEKDFISNGDIDFISDEKIKSEEYIKDIPEIKKFMEHLDKAFDDLGEKL